MGLNFKKTICWSLGMSFLEICTKAKLPHYLKRPMLTSFRNPWSKAAMLSGVQIIFFSRVFQTKTEASTIQPSHFLNTAWGGDNNKVFL